MAESRYGRLFTEADVCAIVAGVLSARGLNPTTVRHDAAGALRVMEQRTTFPADEPLFLLRGQDAQADWGIGAYMRACDADPRVSREHRDAIHRALVELHEWQQRNPDRVKVPD